MSKTLKETIISEIEKSGPLPFFKFMELCLYYPGYGYYRKNSLPIGKAGDFYTSPCVHSIFGHTIARQFTDFIHEIDEEEIYLIEAGAGRGHLARDIGEYLNKKNYKPKLIILEPHKPFRELQYKVVKDFYKDVIFLNEPSELDEINGIFYCNELFDSFPVQLLENRDGSIEEIFVSFENDMFVETFKPISKDKEDFLKKYNIQIPDGFRTEISPLAISYYKQLLGHIKKGFSLVIDYGYTTEEFFTPQRRKGTLMCYKQHLADENPYELVGEKDITAHINFSTFSAAGEEMGFYTIGYTDQQYFLLGSGIIEEIDRIKQSLSQQEYEQEIQKIKNLFMDSMGKTFKFLCQMKGIENKSYKAFGIRDFKITLKG